MRPLVYGETDVMRRRCGELRDQGLDLRATADRLVAQTESVGWTGRAAATLGERIRDRANHLRDLATRHDTAADALEAHLTEVEQLKEAIVGIERRADALAADDALPATFTPPPPGHRDWLSVELPGR